MKVLEKIGNAVTVLFLCGMLAFVLVQWFTGNPS